MKPRFAELLGRYLHREESSIPRLARLTDIPEQTLKNWLAGKTVRPRSRQYLIRIAEALRLNVPETQVFLSAAGHSVRRHRPANPAPPDQTSLDSRSGSREFPGAIAAFQAPMTLPTFVGRIQDLTHLENLLSAESVDRVVCLQGMAGSGKSVLAAELCHRLRDRFPAGIWWAGLDRTDSLSVLRQFADALGLSHDAASGFASNRARVFGHDQDQRRLIVLDGAALARPVRLLLPPSSFGATVLVTTRHDLHLEGSIVYRLHPFAADGLEALDLFRRFLGPGVVEAEISALREIAQLLGQLPLALAIVAGQMAADPEPGKVERILDKLGRTTTRLSVLQRDDLALTASLETHYASLTSEQRKFFADLHVLGLDEFGVAAAAAAAAAPFAEAEARLEWLADRSLIQRISAGRWQFHPLLHDFARVQALKPSASEVSR